MDKVWNALWTGGISTPLEVTKHIFPFLRTGLVQLANRESSYAPAHRRPDGEGDGTSAQGGPL